MDLDAIQPGERPAAAGWWVRASLRRCWPNRHCRNGLPKSRCALAAIISRAPVFRKRQSIRTRVVITFRVRLSSSGPNCNPPGESS